MIKDMQVTMAVLECVFCWIWTINWCSSGTSASNFCAFQRQNTCSTTTINKLELDT